ncbi:hypothetical protein BDN70DRAFT_919967 [Pholiota conissans]|uniref:Protein kinase domain-containing protein n=1 Tax=Pholiota conissans TaxID=109636 RepID=A0A9P5Z4B9_9AGAR|nr:hypothetical protein BDN70DRAFT_919967 [Pholiota conissans]
MGDSPIKIRFVVVDDIDFTPQGLSSRIEMKPTEDVWAMIEKIISKLPSLQIYDINTFSVVKIKQPVPKHTIHPPSGQDSETRQSARHGQGSLQPILAEFRERNKRTTRTELANEYVKLLDDEDLVQTVFAPHDVSLISAILVRLTTQAERAERVRTRPLQPGMTFRCKNLHSIIHGSPPSDTWGHHGIHLRTYTLMDRPANRYTFPVALFDKNLALLQHRFENLDAVFNSDKSKHLFPNELIFYDVADKFILAAIKEHTTEEERMNASRPFLVAIKYKVARIGRSESLSASEVGSSTKLDGAYVAIIGADGSLATTTIVEVKTTVCGDPLSQITKGYAEEVYGFKTKDYFNSTYFPKVFIALNGHKLEIAIAVCLETVVVNEILSLNMRDNLSRGELKQKVARVALALQDCAAQLNLYYSNLTAGPQLGFFPSPTLKPWDTSAPLPQTAFDALPTLTANGPTFRSLKIVGRLDANNVEMVRQEQPDPAYMRHNLFLAKYLDHTDNDPDLVVKLAKRYGETAHRRLAEEMLAPKLILCHHVIGNLVVVVMERAKGSPLNRLKLDGLDKPSIFNQLKKVLAVLKGDNLVHGDLRAPNILVDTGNPRAVQVVDFDWGATHDEGFYPNTINLDELHDEWHGDVGPMKKMKIEHDEFALCDVLGPKYFNIYGAKTI